MWHTPNQRVRAIANAKKRERERNRRPLHIKRILATLESLNARPEEHTKLQIRLLLNDFTSKGAGLFSPHPMNPGDEVTLEISGPKHIKVKARIIWCQEFQANSHVLTKEPFSFRIGIQFNVTPEEEKMLQAFSDELSNNFLYAAKP